MNRLSLSRVKIEVNIFTARHSSDINFTYVRKYLINIHSLPHDTNIRLT